VDTRRSNEGALALVVAEFVSEESASCVLAYGLLCVFVCVRAISNQKFKLI
jgi:hypothetical protein